MKEQPSYFIIQQKDVEPLLGKRFSKRWTDPVDVILSIPTNALTALAKHAAIEPSDALHHTNEFVAIGEH